MSLIWLSHVLEERVPLYGGAKDLSIKSLREIAKGDSCNTSMLVLPTHAGSHVDAPYHFIPNGKSIDDYPPEAWIFECPLLIDVPFRSSVLIGREALPPATTRDSEIDLVLFRTGFEQYRGNDVYWKESPGLDIDLTKQLTDQYINLRAVGIDFISISSLKYRDEGRAAHRNLLAKGILIFEDLSLSEIGDGKRLRKVLAFPLRTRKGDGAPCTMAAFMD